MTISNNTTTLKVPHFKIHEASGRYMARRSLTDLQIIKAAKAILANKLNRVDVFEDACVAKDYLITHFSNREHEVFSCLFLDNQHRLIAFEELFRGTIDGANVYPREVVKRALQLNAAAVIFAHNHPSGFTEPSQADKSITSRLQHALGVVDIGVLDHIIVGGGSAYSFSKHGLI
ncbi:MAG: DNA repair protein RadC [Methylophaga sp.]|nr:DNA repair protein RadC [Methylophaga sp.]